MRRLLSLLAVAATAVACGGGNPTGPSTPGRLPAFTGAYSLVVDASSACRLPASHFEWRVTATTAETGLGGAQAKSTSIALPDGNPVLDLAFYYGMDPDPTKVVGNFETITHGAPGLTIPGNLVFSTNSVLFGDVSAAGTGRAQLTSGHFQGDIVILGPGEEYGDSAPTCIAADHRWTLIPR